MKLPPSPHQHITYLKPLPDDMFNELRSIYERATTYVMQFNVPNEFICDMLWPETESEFNWIVDNVVAFYGVTTDEIATLKYNYDDVTDTDRNGVDRSNWFKGQSGPWAPNSLNFTRFNHDSITERHHGEVECKINIPIVNMGQACIRFIESNECCWYPSPALLNIAYDHDVVGLDRLKTYDLKDRAFFQIVLKKPYKHYSETLPRPNGW